MRSRTACLIAVCTVIGLSSLSAQVDPNRYQWWSHSHATGAQFNPGSQHREVDAHLIHVPGAVSLRVFFDVVNLGDPEDYIEVQSNYDGHLQRLYPHELQKWQNTSAYFNGSSVWVRLVLAPGSTGRYVINQVIGGVGALPGDLSICGATDDRCLSTDWRAMRAVSNPSGSSGGCTIWAANPTDCVLSAGHCTGTFGVAEAEVPLSTSTGGAQHPAPTRQWPITLLQSNNGGVGNDWAISRLAPNSLGELPSQLYGWFNLGFYAPAVNTPTRVTGYGSTTSSTNLSCGGAPTNPLEWDIVNKTHTGPFVSLTGSRLRYSMDTTGGNSGSPVIDDSTGDAIGIHTHGGCGSSGGSNSGTSLTLPAFVTAWNQTCAPPTVPTAAFTSSNTMIIAGNSVSFTDTSLGVPNNWDWDLDGDGTTDSTAQNPSFVYSTPGVYDVSLTVSNALGTDTIVMPGLVVVTQINAVSLPYAQNFNQGLPQQGAGGWSFTSSNGFGRIQASISGPPSPGSGGNALAMDSNTNGNFVTNDASLYVDLAAAGGGILTYNIKETSDENHPEDGLWISDGINPEVLVQPHTGSFANWTPYTIDLAQVASQFGLSLTSNFRITWRQRDNFGAPTDGHFIDDIDISSSFALTFTSNAGDLFCAFTGVPGNATEGFTLMSFDTSMPVGSGSFFGITVDNLTVFVTQQPGTVGGLFHWLLPANGAFPDVPFTLPAGALTGFAGVGVDVVGVTLDGSFNITGTTDVVRETL